jgi:hypothetical protein
VSWLTYVKRTIFEEDLLSITDHDGEDLGDSSSPPNRRISGSAEKHHDPTSLDQRPLCLDTNVKKKLNTCAHRQNVSESSPTHISHAFESPSLCQSNIPPQAILDARMEQQEIIKLERSISPYRKSISTIDTTPPSGEEEEEEESFSGSSTDSSSDIDFLSSEPEANAVVIQHIVSRIKAAVLVRVMEQLHNIFDDTSFVGCANTENGGCNSAKGGASSLVLSRASSRSLAGSNLSTGDNSPAGDDDDDHANDAPRQLPRDRLSQVSPRFACPFFKRDPEKHQTKRACTGPGFEDVKRVK